MHAICETVLGNGKATWTFSWDNTFPLRLWSQTSKLLVLSKSGYVSPIPKKHIKYASSEPYLQSVIPDNWDYVVFILFALFLHVLLFFFRVYFNIHTLPPLPSNSDWHKL